MFKKCLAVLLVFTLLFSMGAITANAASPAAVTAAEEQTVSAAATEVSNPIIRFFYKVVDMLIDTLLTYINKFYHGTERPAEEEFENEYLCQGTEDFRAEPAADAKWYLGYSSDTLLTGNELDGTHYVGGSLSFPDPKTATQILDDQRVRIIAIKDGATSGVVVFAIIDGFGFSNTDVREIRKRLSDYATANNIVGINVGVLHQHSCIDTFGMNADLIRALINNSEGNLTGAKELISGKNKAFMENLFNVTVDGIKQAVANMEPGNLFYGSVDASDYIKDKREPIVFDPNLNRLRFVPDNTASKETYIVNSAIHCVGNGAAGTDVTGDYPYFMEKELNAAGKNFILIQGAELAITSKSELVEVEGEDRYQTLQRYGKRLAELVLGITEETEIEPLLNLAYKQSFVPISNEILSFMSSVGIINDVAVTTKDGETLLVTEMGYMELGKDFAVFFAPGELAPEIAYGGATTPQESWDGKSWPYVSMQEYIGNGKKLLVFGIMNDQVGYILTDNSWHSFLTENEEIVATGEKAGSTIYKDFMTLIDSSDPLVG
ncbi:MAG: hypothetical protein GX051_04635 [Clostridiales bacterium]|nr:hypothetical protein [Clostridiales bacterium]